MSACNGNPNLTGSSMVSLEFISIGPFSRTYVRYRLKEDSDSICFIYPLQPLRTYIGFLESLSNFLGREYFSEEK